MKNLSIQFHLVFAIIFAFNTTVIKAQTLLHTQGESFTDCESLVSFTGRPQNKSIALSWGTLSEFDDQYFNIQRSADGIKWDNIGKIKGTGGSLWAVTYCYVDTNVIQGAYFYRLKTISGDYLTYSSILTVKYDGVPAEINKAIIYPNPTRNVIWIKTEQALNKENVGDISIYNTDGDQVYITKLRDNIQKVDLSDYKKGFYYVKIGTQTYKIYKE